MHIQVKGKQIDIGAALSTHVEDAMAETANKYFDRTVDAVVTFSPEAHLIRCDSTVHLPTGLTMQSTGTGKDAYTAFDQGITRIEKQLRRYKRRLRDHHHHRSKPIAIEAAQSYVIEAPGDEPEDTAATPPAPLDPIIIAESVQNLQWLSVGEAVLQMELADKQFLLFRHEESAAVNLVFRREDGHIGWIDPAPQNAGS